MLFNFLSLSSQKWYDGGFTDNLPTPPFGQTIRVSPFSGRFDICPQDKSQVLTEFKWRNMSVFVNRDNAQRGRYVLFPANDSILKTYYADGYSDTLRFLKEERLS